MKSSGKVRNGPLNKWLNFGGDPDHRLDTGIVFRICHYREIRKVVNEHKFGAHTDSPDGGTGKTCLGGGMHCPIASSFHCIGNRSYISWQYIASISLINKKNSRQCILVALQLENKGKYVSCRLNVWVTGKAVWSFVSTCYTWMSIIMRYTNLRLYLLYSAGFQNVGSCSIQNQRLGPWPYFVSLKFTIRRLAMPFCGWTTDSDAGKKRPEEPEQIAFQNLQVLNLGRGWALFGRTVWIFLNPAVLLWRKWRPWLRGVYTQKIWPDCLCKFLTRATLLFWLL